MKPRHKSMAAVALILLGFAGISGAIAFSQPAEGASLTGQTQMQEATVEGSSPSGNPSEIFVTASGTVEWEKMNEYDAVVSVYVGDTTDEKYRIANEEFYLGDLGNQTSYSFDGVGGDIFSVAPQTGLGPREFKMEYDGKTQTEHVPITVKVTVCEYDLAHGGVCESFTDVHNVTVKVHNEADTSTPTPEASVSGTTEINGEISFAGDESDDKPPEGDSPGDGSTPTPWGDDPMTPSDD